MYCWRFWQGLGLARFLQHDVRTRFWTTRHVWALLAAIVIAASLQQATEQWTSFRALARDNSTEQEAREMLETAPPDAIILASWHRVTPLWVLQENRMIFAPM